jgi:hypothetical protein
LRIKYICIPKIWSTVPFFRKLPNV